MKAKNKLPVIDKIVLVLNIVAVVLLLLSYLAPGTDPRDSIYIAMLGFAYQLLFLGNVVFIIYWLFRKAIFSLISVVGILLGFSAIINNLGFHTEDQPAKKASENVIRIMAFNVHEFKGIEYNDGNPIQKEVVQLIKDKQPDIVNFEEFRVKVADKGAITNSLTKMFKYHYFKPHHMDRSDTLGLSIFSKYPIIKADSVPSRSVLKTRAIFADLDIKGKKVRVYCVHLAAVQLQAKQKGKILNGGISLDKTEVIRSSLSSAFINRSFQVSQIKRHTEDCPYPYIVAGDFNDTPISFAVNELGDGLKNAFREKGSGLVSTYYNRFPKLQIDHILVSQQFNVLNYQAVDRKISDHKAVISDLEFE
jgi:endonuclease/exonuclease/phosphatase family metal-dependent hydrolase